MAIKGLQETVKKALQKHSNDKSLIVAILQDIQAEIGYLPKEALIETGKLLDLPVSRIYSVATFFKAFSLTKRGRHLISVCMGTACHVRGAPKVLAQIDMVASDLGFGLGTCGKDGQGAPVADAQPTLRIEGITVGGTNA